MVKLVSSLIISLDGYVSGPNGELDIFNVGEEFFDFSESLTERSETALYGRGTYEIMASYWPTAADRPDASRHDKAHAVWYNRVEKIVLSRTLQNAGGNTRIISGDISAEINKLKKEKEKDIQIFGSPGAVSTLMQEGLIDEYWLFIAPVVIGHGRHAFAGIKNPVNLKLVSTRTFATGMVLLNYRKV
jgi:dihydrofolate reductase